MADPASQPLALGSAVVEVIKIVGSFIVGFLTSHIKERNDQLAKLMDGLQKLIEDFAESGTRYWMLPHDHADCSALGGKINGLSARIGKELAYLNHEFSTFQFSSWPQLTALRQSVTNGAFQTVGRSEEPNRATIIADDAQALIHEIRRSRRLSNVWRK